MWQWQRRRLEKLSCRKETMQLLHNIEIRVLNQSHMRLQIENLLLNCSLYVTTEAVRKVAKSVRTEFNSKMSRLFWLTIKCACLHPKTTALSCTAQQRGIFKPDVYFYTWCHAAALSLVAACLGCYGEGNRNRNMSKTAFFGWADFSRHFRWKATIPSNRCWSRNN